MSTAAMSEESSESGPGTGSVLPTAQLRLMKGDGMKRRYEGEEVGVCRDGNVVIRLAVASVSTCWGGSYVRSYFGRMDGRRIDFPYTFNQTGDCAGWWWVMMEKRRS